MKRRFALLIISLILMLSACAEGVTTVATQTPEPAASATPAPSPSPSAPPVIAVFGAEDAAVFQDGIRSAAKEGEIKILLVSGGLDALAAYPQQDATVAIVYLTDAPEALPQPQIPVYVFAADGQGVSVRIPQLTYANAGEAEHALDNALTYPPHLSPVRMIGLFSSESSRAYALWSDAKAMGRVFAKMEFFLDTAEEPLASWLMDAFSRYYPGMLDAVYAETGALAIAAAETLASFGRDDIEVFSAGTDSAAAQKLSSILICVVGANEKDAGARCYAEAAMLLTGGAAQNGVLLPESFWYPDNP